MKFLNYKEFLFESFSIETKNIANIGDWIVKAKTTSGEEYVVKDETFLKLYDINSAKIPKDLDLYKLGFMEYNVIPSERTALFCDRKILDYIKQKIGYTTNKDHPLDQEKMLNIINNLKSHFIRVRKKSTAYARQSEKLCEIITKVQKGKPEEIWFEKSWGYSMPISEDDVLIINNGIIRRVALSEFNQTYEK